MSRSPATAVYAAVDLLGFWQFAVDDRAYFGVLERDEADRETTFAIGLLTGSPGRIVKRISNQDASIRAIDARRAGAALLFVLEINRGHALTIVETDLAPLTDPGVAAVTFRDPRNLDLSPDQRAAVRLSPSDYWNVADSLAPARWLFSPRLVRGAEQPDVVANTADGQAAILAGGAPLADAALPQAAIAGGRRYIAFQRFAQPYSPFWSLPRYSNDRPTRLGSLLVADGDAIQDLSSTLDVGPVAGFVLTADANGTPWVMALRDRGAASELVALRRRERGWTLEHVEALDARAEALSVEPAGLGWHLLLVSRGPKGWALSYQRWEIG